jgi:hypothetical protein
LVHRHHQTERGAAVSLRRRRADDARRHCARGNSHRKCGEKKAGTAGFHGFEVSEPRTHWKKLPSPGVIRYVFQRFAFRSGLVRNRPITLRRTPLPGLDLDRKTLQRLSSLSRYLDAVLDGQIRLGNRDDLLQRFDLISFPSFKKTVFFSVIPTR